MTTLSVVVFIKLTYCSAEQSYFSKKINYAPTPTAKYSCFHLSITLHTLSSLQLRCFIIELVDLIPCMLVAAPSLAI